MLLIHEVDLREFRQKQIDINEIEEEDRKQPNFLKETTDNYYHERRLFGGHHFCEIYLLTNDMSNLIGYVSYWHSPDLNVKRSKLLEIHIYMKYQGKGFGSRIIKKIMNEALEYGSLYFSLVVFSRNTIAHAIYKKLGFVSWKKFENSELLISSLH